MMEILRGSPALSEFRIKKLLYSLKKAKILVNQIYTEYMYFVDIRKPLTFKEKQSLNCILKSNNIIDYNNLFSKGRLFLVTTRPGTISPWSTKASNIIYNCNLKKIIRIERGIAFYIKALNLTKNNCNKLTTYLHDKMMETIFFNFNDAIKLFIKKEPKPLKVIDIINQGKKELFIANIKLGLFLTKDEINYLFYVYTNIKRNPNDIELYMFAQMNSEHCRHKIFNANWIIDNKKKQKSLFQMIKSTFNKTPDHVLSAYKDNAAVMEGSTIGRFFPNINNGIYDFHHEKSNILMKVETHNHPTAIAPWQGAATGSGGEIRDAGATGCGGKPKAGLIGFSVSNLNIPGFKQPWEQEFGKPSQIVSALDIIINAPLGAASFNNEFGRPIINGFFRTYEELVNSHNGIELRGYHKPIMLSGGIGNIRTEHIIKKNIVIGSKLIVLGGPAMKIGLGGSTASSVMNNKLNVDLDFASVQRDNAEMERRCQEVIDSCWQLGNKNPILFIHDVGAGGLSNAIPELMIESGYGCCLNLRDIPVAETGMSPLEIWCNESQERYVLAILPDELELFNYICNRECAPYSVIGTVTKQQNLKLKDSYFKNVPINIKLSLLLENTPKITKNIVSKYVIPNQFLDKEINLEDAIKRILHLPVVAEKSFLITISDRNVTGMVSRDQMIGPWQIPIANCAITAASFDSYHGEAFSIGERAPVALLDFISSGCLAIGEALTNLASTHIGSLKRIKLSANWMVASDHPGEDAGLYEMVKNVSEKLCTILDLSIPVGKDSMSMKTTWYDKNKKHEMIAPLSLIITAFARVEDIRNTVTPQLQINNDNLLLFLDLGNGNNALGATALTQVYRQLGDKPATMRDVKQFKNFFNAMQILIENKKLLAYHDRSDGGLLVTLAEMSFAGHCGIDVNISELNGSIISILFNEELGVVMQIINSDFIFVKKLLHEYGFQNNFHVIGKAFQGDNFIIRNNNNIIYNQSRTLLRTWWAETTWKIQRLRDNPICADQEHQAKQDNKDPGLNVYLTFNTDNIIESPMISLGIQPKIAILREQGINSHIEMAAAFNRAGFTAIDVHMNDLLTGKYTLNNMQALVACGGFSYGDVLGAGEGWAKSILFNSKVREEFEKFFNRSQIIALGVCNGCQMMSHLHTLIPGSNLWPKFIKNRSERFESRFSLVKIENSKSLLFDGMQGSHMPIAISHGEGCIKLKNFNDLNLLESKKLIVLRYINNYGKVTELYPFNPNGSINGITALTNENGNITIMMPHPERVFRTVTNSWYPKEWKENSPWMQMFLNARKYFT